MLPELANGDFVIVSRFFWALNQGDLVIAEHAKYQRIIKRITQCSKTKGFLLSGTNKASVSTADMGWISPQKIFGKVLLTIKR
ncbi:MAG: hypothetical protein COB34_02660 [Methylophilaceae bacterium]|nr:MAG: hypothetical protein COB34_02660 [Methylophilaceae bacterium]